MNPLTVASLLLISLAACTEAADDVGPATTGIYRLEAHPVVQTCAPSTATATQWTVALARTADRLSYVTPGASPNIATLERHETDAALRSEFELPLQGTCAHGLLRHQFEAFESPDRVDATLDYVWSDVTQCAGDPISELLPASDCRTLRNLTYQLIEPCEAPCVIRQGASDDLTCSC